MNPMRPYQERSIEALRRAMMEGARPVLSLPTGGGKTRIASEIFRLAREKNKRVAFVVPFISLINQTYRAFAEIGLGDEIGVMQGQHEWTDPDKPIQICSIQTLQKRELPDSDLVVFDEVHLFYKRHKEWMETEAKTRFIGLSATPWRKGLGDYFDRMIVAATVDELIRDGYLAPYRFFAPSIPDLKGVKVTAGDYQQDQLSELMQNKTLIADTVTTWIERAEGRATFVFAVDCAHAKALQIQFQQSGIQAGYVDAYTPVDEREILIDMMRKGELKVIVNVGTMTTGVDAPFVSCIQLCRPTRSKMLYMQIIGRGLRVCEGKKDCLILDHSATALTLGLPADIEQDDFAVGKEDSKSDKKAEPLPKPCPKCSYLKPPRTRTCPACGHEAQRPPGHFHEDGELVELTGKKKSGRAEKLHVPNGCVEIMGVVMEERIFFAELLGYARSRGYREGWASNKYREKTGKWPGSTWRHDGCTPSEVVSSWIRAQAVAWGRAKRREEKRRMA